MSHFNEISNILICDDHFVSAIGVEMLLNQHFHYPLNIKRTTSGKEVLQAVSQESPDLFIIDLGLPDISGLEVIKQIRKSSDVAKIIVLTGLNEPHILRQVHQLKVNGILKKTNTGKNLGEALNFLKKNNDETFLDSLTHSILNEQGVYIPTRRESEVLELMSKGHTSEEIANQLKCSLSTIKTYRARIMNKSGARNSAEMISWYLKRN